MRPYITLGAGASSRIILIKVIYKRAPFPVHFNFQIGAPATAAQTIEDVRRKKKLMASAGNGGGRWGLVTLIALLPDLVCAPAPCP